jgi:hypothetical protein
VNEKHFKARLEPVTKDSVLHSAEFYFKASNIIAAGHVVMEWIGVLGYGPESVTKLIEIDEPHR